MLKPDKISKPLNLIEAKQLLESRSNNEVMDAYLTVGGVPEYLARFNNHSPLLLSLCEQSFVADAFFSHESKRIFVSRLAGNKNYKQIIHFLSKRRFANRDDILRHLQMSSGGQFSALLLDLEAAGFIKKYTPYNLSAESMLARYAIADDYLQFYFKFIKPNAAAIEQGRFNINPINAITKDTFYKWLGFAFERWCRRYSHVIAQALGFGIVNYQSGVFFNRASNKENPDYQIDLLFDRADNVITICEIKYLQTKVTSKIITEFERKLELFPNKKNKTIHKVLITTIGAEKSLIDQCYFDHIITLDDLFDERIWA